MIAVLGAFPSELAAVLEQATVDETMVVEGRILRTGHIGRVPVVMGMTGIGLLNAAAMTRIVLDNFPVTGVVVSGVAGSPHRIADVTVPEVWSEPDGESYPAERGWVRRVAALNAVAAFALERCTTVRTEAVCMGFQPEVFVGGAGSSSDSFGDIPFRCSPNGGDVFGCDVEPPAPAAAARALLQGLGTAATTAEPIAVDMETAAVARVATEHGVPYIAFRAVSDGAEDPLGLPGFPAQFFAYYPIAAHNAAVAAAAFVADLAR